jgi:hypothetical protein
MRVRFLAVFFAAFLAAFSTPIFGISQPLDESTNFSRKDLLLFFSNLCSEDRTFVQDTQIG